MQYPSINSRKDETTWSSQMQKNNLTKIQHLFVIKTPNKVGIEGNFLNPIKVIYQNKPELISHFMVKDRNFPPQDQE